MARRPVSPRARTVIELVMAISRVFFRLRAAGREIGAVSPAGQGTWGFLRSLRLEGPLTVPQLARARPVARQYIQKMADELAAGGLIEFIDNPAHRRSRLMRLTKKGEALHDAIERRVAAAGERMAEGLDDRALEGALAVMRQLARRLAAAPEEEGPPARTAPAPKGAARSTSRAGRPRSGRRGASPRKRNRR